MRELVQHGDSTLVLEPFRVGKLPLEGSAKDRDLVGQVLVGFPEPEQIGIFGIFVLDHDRDVRERLRDLRRELVERRLNVRLEGRHQRGRSGARTWSSRTASAPKANPPTCAAKATPPPASGCVIEKPPCQSWNTNQKLRKKSAEIGTGRKPKSSVSTRALGRSTRYAPSTP